MMEAKPKETIVTLKKSREFRRVFKRGKKFFSRYMVVYFMPNGLYNNRYGFAISKKVGNSVVRHRIKRLFAEVLRKMQGEVLKGYDFVIVAKKNAVEMDYHQCRRDVIKTLKREGLMESSGKRKKAT